MFEAQGREWRFYLDDMIEFAEKVLAYTDVVLTKPGLWQAGLPTMPRCAIWN